MTRSRAGIAVLTLALLALLTLLALLVARKAEGLPFNPTFDAATANPSVGVNADLSLQTQVITDEHLPLQVVFSIPAFDFTTSNAHLDEVVGSGNMIVNDDVNCEGSASAFPFTILEVETGEPSEKARYQTSGIPFTLITLILEGSVGSGHTITAGLFVGGEAICQQGPLDLTFTFNGISSPGSLPVVTNPSSAGFYTLSGLYAIPNPFHPEGPGSECSNNLDDDDDGSVNDGCPVVGVTESDGSFPTGGPLCTDNLDDDSDGFVNDGCPAVINAQTLSEDVVCIVPCPTPTGTATATPTVTPTVTPTATATPIPVDTDGDGMTDSYESAHSCLDPATDDAALDPDGDGFTNLMEFLIGTDPCDECPDDPSHDAWPTDANRGVSSFRVVNGLDVFLWAQRFGSTTSFTPPGKLPYTARYDLDADNTIDGLDVFFVAQDFNETCL